jgi:hypothetical protein
MRQQPTLSTTHLLLLLLLLSVWLHLLGLLLAHPSGDSWRQRTYCCCSHACLRPISSHRRPMWLLLLLLLLLPASPGSSTHTWRMRAS